MVESLCVYCRLHPVHPDRRPFCSERCRLLDLSHWLHGDYRASAVESDGHEADENDAANPPED